MKRFMTIRCFSMLLLACVWAGCPRQLSGGEDDFAKCIRAGPIEGNPQSDLFRGGCLEFALYVKGSLTAEGELSTPSADTLDVLSGKTYSLEFQNVGATEILGKRVPLYKVTSNGRDLCANEEYDPMGVKSQASSGPPSGVAMLAPGYWDKDGNWHGTAPDGGRAFSVSCMSGVIAKCEYWGYVPGHEFKGERLDRYHRTCVRAARAMYEDARADSYTCRGLKIDIYDRLGIQKKEGGELKLEALWAEDRLACLARPRLSNCHQGLPTQLTSCEDPVEADRGEWPSSYDDKVLIAIGSAVDRTALTCAQPGQPANCAPRK